MLMWCIKIKNFMGWADWSLICWNVEIRYWIEIFPLKKTPESVYWSSIEFTAISWELLCRVCYSVINWSIPPQGSWDLGPQGISLFVLSGVISCLTPWCTRNPLFSNKILPHVDGLVQKRNMPIVNTVELPVFFTYQSIILACTIWLQSLRKTYGNEI